MSFKEYLQRLMDLPTSGDNMNLDNLIEMLKWLQNDGASLYKKEFLSLINYRQLRTRDENRLIEQAIPKNINDWKRKQRDKNYYIANALIYLEIADWIANSTLDALGHYTGENTTMLYNYADLIDNLLLDSIILLNSLKLNLHNAAQEELYGVGKSPIQRVLTIWQLLKQTIFGQVSFHSFINRGIDISNLIIRMAIEIRLRRGFGIIAKIRKSDSSVHHLPVSLIIQCVKDYRNDIAMAVPLHIIERIYGWANIFTHSGIRQYSWLPIKLSLYLEEFMMGKREQHTKWSAHNGIRMSKETLRSIQNSIRQRIDKNTFEIWSIPRVDAIVE